MIFRQLFEPVTSTYTYLLGDPETREAVLIDPVLETVDRDLRLVSELGLKVKYVLDTHVHADHVTGAGEIRSRTGAKTAVAATAGVSCVDVPLKEGDTLQFGPHTLRVIATPGHTNACVSFLVGDRLFTGDALFVRGTGRTDFQQGNPRTLYKSVTGKLFSLPPETRVYPGHDYRGFTHSTIQEEREFNPRLGGGRSEDEFVRIMSELKLPNPKQIHEAVPANLACGQKKEQKMKAQMVDGVPEVSPEQVEEARKTTNPPRLIDCRFDNEFVGELGHVPGSELVTLGDELMKYLQDGAPAKDKAAEIVFICRSGNRSGHATMLAQQLGYKNVYNMSGGMILWNELRLPVERDARR